MAIRLSYSQARARLAELMDRAEADREAIIITRHGKPSAVLLSAEEWEGMEATLHLLRSPRNAARLFEAMAQIERGEGVEMTTEELRRLLPTTRTQSAQRDAPAGGDRASSAG